MHRLTRTFGLVVLAAALAACSGASAAPETTGQPPADSGGDAVRVVAQDIAFTTPAITVTAGAPVRIVFDNRDGAPHNMAISDASGQAVFKGEIVSNTTVTYAVPALTAGTYTFICEVHPNMQGTITAQ